MTMPPPISDNSDLEKIDLEKSQQAQAYFEAIEEAFIRWRGAPFLVASADWHLVREWHQQGIPLAIVEDGLREFFKRRQEQKKDSKIWSLRQCKRSVEGAWSRHKDLEAPIKSAASDPEANVDQRLQALARSLPTGLPDLESWRLRLTGLAGDSEHVETQLAKLDQQMLAAIENQLDRDQRRALDDRLQSSLQTLAQRLPAEELTRASGRLRQQLLREIVHLPVLSLFSPEAQIPRESGAMEVENPPEPDSS